MLETLCRVPFVWLKNYFSQNEVVSYTDLFEKTWKFRAAPLWLGGFSFSIYQEKNLAEISIEAKNIMRELARLVSEQTFNTLFVQKYITGQEVKPHRDPKNNIESTILTYFGAWTGGLTNISHGGENIVLDIHPGDVLIMPCTIAGVQGPRHWVTPIASGTKYSFILNTIK